MAVLLVEDSAAIRALVRRMLVAGGHTVVEAAGQLARMAADLRRLVGHFTY